MAELIKISPQDLEQYAWGNYVDSPVYFKGNWLVRWLNWAKLKTVLSLIDNLRNNALDVGSGNGVLLPSLSKIYDEVIAYDKHCRAAWELKKGLDLKNTAIIQGDFERNNFKPGAFNSIFVTSSLEHFADLPKIIDEIDRVLKPGGKVYFCSPTENWLYRIGRKILGYEKPSDHYWTAKQIDEELRGHFIPEVVKCFPWGLPVYLVGRYGKI